MPEKGHFASVANDPSQEECYPNLGNSVVQNAAGHRQKKEHHKNRPPNSV